jgi:AraC-like DNA-binding protein
MIKNFQYRKVCNGRDYIADRYTASFCLTEVANYSCMSRYHFSRTFLKTFGESPNDFLVRLRIEKAKQMLITENYSISEICERIGYVSIGSFSNRFKEKVGISPTQYRRRLWNLSSEPLSFPMQSIPMCYAHHLFGAKIRDADTKESNFR